MHWEGPSARGFCPGSPEIREAQFRKHTRLHCGPSVPYKAGRSRRAAGGGAREPHGRRGPAARPARAPRSGTAAASRDAGARAWRPAPSCREPGPAAAAAARAPGRGLRRGRGPAGGGCQVAPVTVTYGGVGGASTQVAYFRK